MNHGNKEARSSVRTALCAAGAVFGAVAVAQLWLVAVGGTDGPWGDEEVGRAFR